jgi:integrase
MSLYHQEGSPLWYANISVPGQPRLRRSTGTEDRAEAQRIHDQWKADLWELAPSAGPEHFWSEAVEAWLDVQARSDSELLSLKKFGKRYPDRALSAVTPESLEDALSFTRTAGTYTRYRTMLTAILNVAKTKGWIAVTPVMAQRKDRKKKPRKWITREQWERLLAELPAHMKPMAAFGLFTGLRQANVLGLRWAQVDLDRAFLWLEAEETKDDDALPVPLSKEALQVLRDVKGQHAEFCFTYRGRPISEIKTAWINACIRAGLGEYRVVAGSSHYEGFTWHGLRHTWATWHVQNETPLDVLQQLGGWSDLRMVQNYAHHSPGHLAAFADNVGPKGKRAPKKDA